MSNLELFSAGPDGHGAADRNCGKAEGAVAPHHESVPTRAHDGSASGVSAQPSLRDMVIHGGDMSLPMPSAEQLKTFLREYYLHSRFEGRDSPVWGNDYSDVVTESTRQSLEGRGITCVSMYDCNRGRAVWFDRSLTVLNPDEAPAQVQKQPGNLTHIYGQAL
jgi:hypothetical protein